MSLDSLINLQITRATRTPTRPGFGTALIMAQTVPGSWGSRLVRSFASLTEITSAGFAVTDPAYLAASKLFAQNPRPALVKIAKRTLLATRLIDLTIPDATTGRVYTLVIDGVHITRTVPGASSVSAEATAIAALVTGGTVGATATAVGAVITITAAAGKVIELSGWATAGRVGGIPDLGLVLHDRTVDPGIATNLASIQAEDHDWYGLIVDQAGALEVTAATAWVEANGKIFPFDVIDTACEDPASTSDILYTQNGLAHARSGGIYSNANALHYSGAAWLGSRLCVPPGSDTWAFKSLVGVTPSVISEGAANAIHAKMGNTYRATSGLPLTEEGHSASGEYFDIVRGIDWLQSEIQIRILTRLANAEKVPYTNAGRDVILSIMEGALADGVRAGLLASTPAPTATGPDVATVDPSIRATRTLPSLAFTGTLAGAIHKLQINGNVSV